MVNGSVPETRYARTTDGLDIAYQTLGNGGVDVLKLATYFGNIEHDWASPGVAGVNRALAELGRLITFDGRGTGLSEILVSETVRGLVAGSHIGLQDAGEHELKGVPDRWRLYRVVG